ncbi:MAG: hypothetical protein ACFCUP_09935 [Actinomycetales bacterium]
MLATAPAWVLVPLVLVVVCGLLGVLTVALPREPSPDPHRPTHTFTHRHANPYADRYADRSADVREDPVPAAHPQPYDPTDPYAGLPDNHLLVPAPTVTTRDGRVVPLADWLRRETGRDGVWAEVVTQFYARAAAAPAVADYFTGIDMDRLHRHFLAALVMVTSRGVTVGTVRRMSTAHAHVRDSAGRPVTADIWTAVLATLTGILTEHRVPPTTLTHLAAALAPLRPAIVVEP